MNKKSNNKQTEELLQEKSLPKQVITDVPKKIKLRKQKQKHYYSRYSLQLPKLHGVDAIRMQLPCKKEWSLGHIIAEEGTCSYLVEVNERK